MTLLEACVEAVSRSWIDREFRRRNHRKLEGLPLDVGNVLLEDVVKRHAGRLSPAMISAFKECVSRIVLNGSGQPHGGQWLAEIALYRHLSLLKMANYNLSYKARSNYLYLLEHLADSLTTLHLKRCGCFTQSALGYISRCCKLRNLDLSGTTMCIPSSCILNRALTSLAGLTSLALGDVRAVDDCCCGGIAGLTGLQSLVLSGCESITDGGVAKLVTLTGLTSLDISWTFATRPPLVHGLRDLSMNHCTLAGAEDAVVGASQWPLIERLDLRGADVNNRRSGWQLLHNLVNVKGSAKTLTHLDMGSTDVTNFEFLQGCGNITLLNLFGAKIMDSSLAGLTLLSELVSLQLSHTLVTSQGLQHLVALPKLQVLSVASTRVGNSSFALLARMPSLTDVDMSDNALWTTTQPTASNQSDADQAAMVALDRLFDRQQSFHSDVEGGIDIAGMFVEGSDQDSESLEPGRGPQKSCEVYCESSTAGSHLKRLNLMNTRWTDWGVTQLVTYSPRLVALAVGNEAISNGTIKALQGLLELESLELQGGIITMDGIDGLKVCGKLRTVKITCTWRELLSCEQLPDLYDSMPTLEQLHVNGCLVERRQEPSGSSAAGCVEACWGMGHYYGVCRRYSTDYLMRLKLRSAQKMDEGDAEELRIVGSLCAGLLPEVAAGHPRRTQSLQEIFY